MIRGVSPNKQLQRTVIPNRWRAARASFHCAHTARWTAQRAAAEPRRSATVLFGATDEDSVRRFLEAGLRAGRRNNGAPALRRYHASYFSAFPLDPDGNNVETVWHGETSRSASALVVER
jgi:hypothetical protein